MSRSAVRFGWVVVALMLVGVAATPAGAKEPDPVGRPKGLEPGLFAGWYVWNDGDTWHIRTTTKKNLVQFGGTVQVVGGKITSVSDAKLEGKGATKDWWNLSKDQQTLTLDLETKGGMDGFDFKVGNKANEVIFTLKIEGKEKPDQIHVGRDGGHPSGAKFVLPANPTK